MADSDFNALVIPALNALASSPAGSMTLSDLVAHLEARHGSTEENAKSAQSVESRVFRDKVQDLLSPTTPGSIVSRGLATTDGTGALVTLTQAGRSFIGR